MVRELIKKYGKLRGYRQKNKSQKIKFTIVALDLEKVAKLFKAEDKITPEILLEKKIIRRIKNKIPKVKILGKGKLIKSLTFEGCQVSKQAKEIIEKAGGTIKNIPQA